MGAGAADERLSVRGQLHGRRHAARVVEPGQGLDRDNAQAVAGCRFLGVGEEHIDDGLGRVLAAQAERRLLLDRVSRVVAGEAKEGSRGIGVTIFAQGRDRGGTNLVVRDRLSLGQRLHKDPPRAVLLHGSQ